MLVLLDHSGRKAWPRDGAGPRRPLPTFTGGNEQEEPALEIALRTREKVEALRAAAIEMRRTSAEEPTERASTSVAPAESSMQPQVFDTEREGPLTLRRLVDAYWHGADFEANGDGTKDTKTSSARILLGHFTEEQLVEDITEDGCRRFQLRRENGGIEYTDYDATPTGRILFVKKTTGPVKKRAVQADLKFLRTMINWAVKNWRSAGLPRLTSNPIAGFKMPREKNPTRRIMPHERYLAIREAAGRMAVAPELSEMHRLRMRMFCQAFELGEVFGRRAGSIGDVVRSDFIFDRENGFANAEVNWRWTAEKTGETSSIPLPPDIAEQIWNYCEEMPLPPSGRLFWKIGTDEPINTDILGDLLHEAERAAGLLPIPYMGWHSLRRKWATERKDLPIKDAMAVGGWRDAKTFLGYQQTDPDTMLAVLEHGAKLHSDGWLRTTDGSSRNDRRAVLPGRM